MSGRDRPGIDPRACLAWAFAASLPPLLGRNPFALAATMLAVLGVGAAWAPVARRGFTGVGLLRLAVILVAVGVLFNVLTYHGGDVEIVSVPNEVPILGGTLTLNALVYGLLGGFALLTLVIVATTVSNLLDWSAVLRLMPDRMTTVAVAGSVAFAFLPQTAGAYRDIREAQAARGHRLRGARDLAPLLVPLLTLGLERAVTLAEALESRAFGALIGVRARRRSIQGVSIAFGLTAALSAGFLLAIGKVGAATASMAIAVALVGLVVRGRSDGQIRRTRFRSPAWRHGDTAIVVAAVIAAAATLVSLSTDPAALRYEPYPAITLPRVSLPLLVALAGLLTPAFFAPRLVELGRAGQ